MIKEDTVKKMAQLARLRLTAEETTRLSDQLSNVIEYFQQITKVDTTDLEPLFTPLEHSSCGRQDRIDAFVGDPEKIMSLAPERLGNLYKVPPVV